MNWYKIAKKAKHHYSWVYVDLPEEVQTMIIQFGQEIDPDDLYDNEGEDGLETEPHITVKYGLLTDDKKEIKDQLDGEKGGKAYLGESSIFEGEKYDVVKIDIESKDLGRLHTKLNELPHEDKHPTYHAHATIAYVKKGKGKKYIGKFKINDDFKFKEVFFGDTKDKDTKIKLGTSYNLCKVAKKSIQTIATEVRANQVKCYGGDEDCLKATCLPSSRALKAELIKNGYEAMVVQGTFYVENPDPSATEGWDINDFKDEEEMEDATHNPLHYWVEIIGKENTIVDITADQFNNEIEGETMGPITIGSHSSLGRYTVIHKDWI